MGRKMQSVVGRAVGTGERSRMAMPRNKRSWDEDRRRMEEDCSVAALLSPSGFVLDWSSSHRRFYHLLISRYSVPAFPLPNRCSLGCAHVFCFHCIRRCVDVQHFCPMCRTSITALPLHMCPLEAAIAQLYPNPSNLAQSLGRCCPLMVFCQ
jgi:hypothetical protein